MSVGCDNCEQGGCDCLVFDGSCDHRDIRTFYTSELSYLEAMQRRYSCPNCATATGTCSSCVRLDERIATLREGEGQDG